MNYFTTHLQMAKEMLNITLIFGSWEGVALWEVVQK